MNLNIEQFNPKKEELLALVDQYSWLTINWIEDKAWYNVLSSARKNLKAKRCEIKKIWEEMREEANKFSKLVKKTADDYIAIIEPMEDKLEEIENNYLELVKIEKRKEDLPARKEKIQWLSEISDEDILKMEDWAFDRFVFELQQEKLRKDQEALEAEKARIAEEERKKREEEEQQKRIEQAKEQARIEAEQKAQKEIDRLKAEQEAEKARQEKEKSDAETKAKAEEEQARLEDEKTRKNKTYTQFLSDQNYNQETDKIERNWNNIKLYRLVAEINID